MHAGHENNAVQTVVKILLKIDDDNETNDAVRSGEAIASNITFVTFFILPISYEQPHCAALSG